MATAPRFWGVADMDQVWVIEGLPAELPALTWNDPCIGHEVDLHRAPQLRLAYTTAYPHTA